IVTSKKLVYLFYLVLFSSRRRHTRSKRDWSSDVCSSDLGYTIYEYNPTVFKPFHVNMEPLTWKRRIRLLMAITSGFKVYYLVDGENYTGYFIVQNCKDKRYKFATKNDILVGPYFVSEKYRGKKLSIFLLDFILKK